MGEGEGELDANLTEDALMLFVVSGLVRNNVGVAKMDALRAADFGVDTSIFQGQPSGVLIITRFEGVARQTDAYHR
jgi:hypothetical protein